MRRSAALTDAAAVTTSRGMFGESWRCRSEPDPREAVCPLKVV
jgi:hypothetical protein